MSLFTVAVIRSRKLNKIQRWFVDYIRTRKNNRVYLFRLWALMAVAVLIWEEKNQPCGVYVGTWEHHCARETAVATASSTD
uniref:Uncharacterized protein n=1 Tax=Oryza barthii TaxID=65489 RepID=A0A0D3HWI7_9ORYZ